MCDIIPIGNDWNRNKHFDMLMFTFLAHKMDWTSYHRLDDIYGYLKYLADTYPKLVRLIDIGTSYEDRPLYVVRISNSSSPDTQPAVWIDAGISSKFCFCFPHFKEGFHFLMKIIFPLEHYNAKEFTLVSGYHPQWQLTFSISLSKNRQTLDCCSTSIGILCPLWIPTVYGDLSFFNYILKSVFEKRN